MNGVNFSTLCEANKTIRTTNIKGKEYAEVPQRIKAFRMVYPEGFIITELLSNENGVCVFRAECGYYDENGNAHVTGTGTAYEKESGSFINRTSYIENCETSAVGRALGMAGFGIDISVASAEEVSNAILNQQELEETPEDAVPQTVLKKEFDAKETIKAFCSRNGITGKQYMEYRNALVAVSIVPDIKSSEMTLEQVDTLNRAIKDNFLNEVKSA